MVLTISRKLEGFLVAPLISAIIWLLPLLFSLAANCFSGKQYPSAAIFGNIFGQIIAFCLGAFFIGLPVIKLLNNFNIKSQKAYINAGVIIGIIIGLALPWLISFYNLYHLYKYGTSISLREHWMTIEMSMYLSLFMALIFGISFLVYWLIAVRNPKDNGAQGANNERIEF